MTSVSLEDLVALAGLVPALALYTRLAKPSILENPTRGFVLRYVQENPDARCAEVARAAGIAYKTAERHLRLLVRFGFAAAAPAPSGALYSVCGGGQSRPERARRAALRNGRLRAVYELVLREPGLGVTEVARRLGISKSTASERLSKLRDAGALAAASAREGRVFGFVVHEQMPEREDRRFAQQGGDTNEHPNPNHRGTADDRRHARARDARRDRCRGV